MLKHLHLGSRIPISPFLQAWSTKNLGRSERRMLPQGGCWPASSQHTPQHINDHRSQPNPALERDVVSKSRRERTHLPLEF